MRGLFLRPVLWPAIKVTGDSNWVFSTTKIMVAIHSVSVHSSFFPLPQHRHKEAIQSHGRHSRNVLWPTRGGLQTDTRRWFYRNLQPSFSEKRVCASVPLFAFYLDQTSSHPNLSSFLTLILASPPSPHRHHRKRRDTPRRRNKIFVYMGHDG